MKKLSAVCFVLLIVFAFSACNGSSSIFSKSELKSADRIVVNDIELSECSEVLDYLAAVTGEKDSVDESLYASAIIGGTSPMYVYSGENLLYTVSFDKYPVSGGEEYFDVKGITVNGVRYKLSDNCPKFPAEQVSPTE